MKIRDTFCGNDISDVINAKSEVIKQGRIYEISATNGKHLARFIFLVSFSSLVIITSSIATCLRGESLLYSHLGNTTTLQLWTSWVVLAIVYGHSAFYFPLYVDSDSVTTSD